MVRTAPLAEDSNIDTIFAVNKSTVSRVKEPAEARTATPPHTPDTPAAINTQVRRRKPRSTTGDQRKYQTVGREEIATTSAMRSTETPC